MYDPGSSGPQPPRAPSGTEIEYLTLQLSALTEVLESVDDNPRLIDASLDDVHKIAALVAKTVKRLASESDLFQNDPYRHTYDMFDHARSNENDTYEIYADDLERFQQRQHRDLTVADSDSDKFAVVKRRRIYIAILFELHSQIAYFIDSLKE
jgi:hypothetical protein